MGKRSSFLTKMTHNFTTNYDKFGIILLTFFKKILLEVVGGRGWGLSIFLSLTHPHSQISIRISIFNVKMKKKRNKKTRTQKKKKKVKMTREHLCKKNLTEYDNIV